MTDEPSPEDRGAKGRPPGESCPLSDARGQRERERPRFQTARACFLLFNFILKRNRKQFAQHSEGRAGVSFLAFHFRPKGPQSWSRHHGVVLDTQQPQGHQAGLASRTGCRTLAALPLFARLRFLGDKLFLVCVLETEIDLTCQAAA